MWNTETIVPFSPIRDLEWDDWNEEHIGRHHVTPEEVEDVCFGQHLEGPAKGKNVRACYGQTSAGRYMIIILASRGGGFYYPVTARQMTDIERRRYQRWLGR
jgi:uncharacterized protein